MDQVSMYGAPHAMGRQHGQQLVERLPRSVALLLPASPEARQGLLRDVLSIETFLLRACPDLVEEMQGIAKGSRIDYSDILRINAGIDAVSHCTAIGLPATPWGPLLGKTDDTLLAERELDTIFRAEPDDGFAFVCLAYAGTVWNHGGINAAGFGLVMTGLPPAGVRNGAAGMPSLFLLRRLLHRCSTVTEALEMVRTHPLRGWGCSITMADRTSPDVVVVEDYPAAWTMRRYADSASVHTNHPRYAETIALRPDSDWMERNGVPGLEASSQARLHNAAQLIKTIPRTVVGVQHLLADHSQPGAICQHGRSGLHTAAAMVVAPWQRCMWMTAGYGCQPFVEYRP